MKFAREAKITNKVGIIFTDSQSALYLSKNPVYRERSKYNDVKVHYVCDKVSAGDIRMCKIGTQVIPTDVGAKIIHISKVRLRLKLLGVG